MCVYVSVTYINALTSSCALVVYRVLIVTLYHGVFVEVCEVENVNFSQQADEAAIRNWYMCVYRRMCVCGPSVYQTTHHLSLISL